MRNQQLRITKRLHKAAQIFLESGDDSRLRLVAIQEKGRMVYWIKGSVIIRSKQKRRTVTAADDITQWTKRKAKQ